MANKLQREDDIDSAYNVTPGADELRSAEGATDDSYANAGLDQLEAYANDPANAARDNVESQETDTSDGSGGWTVNRSPDVQKGGSTGSTAVKILKKGGPGGILLSVLLGLGGLFSFFGGPGLLIVNLAEKMTEKFNHQLTSMDIRTNKIIVAKIKNTTTGVCTPVKIKCKFASFSTKEIENFKRAGIEIIPDQNASRTLTGRTKASGFKYNGGPEIKAGAFASELKNNTSFAQAVRNGYNPKFAGMSDAIANKVFAKLKISKRSPLPAEAASDEERLKAVEEQTKNGQTGSLDAHKVGDYKNQNCQTDGCPKYTQADIDAEKATGTIGDEAGKVDKEDSKSSSKALSELADKGPVAAGKLTNLVKITGIADNACSVYGMMKAVSIAAKTIRMAQMARFAMVFLTTASMIKAGDAKPEDVSFLGTVLTKTFTSTDSKGGKATTLPATDSFGYRYAAFGDKGINEAATPFLSGGGLTGSLSGATSAITSVIGGPKSADKTCGTLRNPFVQGASFLGGLALMIIPGTQGISGANIAGQLTFAALTFAAEMLLPALLADIIAGKLVDKNTVGEPAGNAIAAGSGGMMSQLAISGGNAPLTKTQAKQMIAVNEEVKLSYAASDRATKSPFDISSPNTFMGSIASGFIPYIYSGDQTFFGKIRDLASISVSSIGNFAVSPSYADTTESFDECTDVDYQNINLATDPFCNIVAGIPSASMNDDPNVVNDRLLAKKLIDEDTGAPIGEYAEFVTKCMDREEPFGSTGEDSTADDGTGCFLDGSDQTKGDMYVHYVDMRVNDGMENGLNAGTQGPSTAKASQTASGGYALPVDQKWYDQHPEWFSKPHHDYAAADVPVPLGTPVYSMTAGRVTAAPNEGGYGEGVTILGDDGVQYNYGHGSDGGVIVKAGDNVKAGQLIMHSASTGHSTGAHLHVDMRIGGVKHCPQNLLVALGKKSTTLPTPESLPTSGCSN